MRSVRNRTPFRSSLGCAAALVAALLLAAPRAAAQAEEPEIDAYARVITAEATVRSGPGISHRVIYRAERGETFLVDGREGSGYWLRILLADGRVGYLIGDTVETIAADPDSDEFSKPGFFAPPALQEARGGFALMGGVFDRNGYVELRPAIVLAPAISLEPYVGMALHADGRRLLYGGGGTLNLAPDWAVAPFFHIGGGWLDEDRESSALEDESRFHARAGGGFLISLRWRILVRLEANNTVIFTEDSYRNAQTYYGGLGAYF